MLICEGCGLAWPVDDIDADDAIATCPECAR
jgi:predicted  nucleic acid-binding Zn-ribbon protein